MNTKAKTPDHGGFATPSEIASYTPSSEAEEVESVQPYKAEPKTSAERMTSFRQRQSALGRKQCVFYLTDLEHEYLKVILEMVREELPDWKSAR